MKKIFNILLVAGLFSLFSCENFFETVVEIDPPESIPQLAMSAFWNNTDTLIAVFVDGTSDIFSGRKFGFNTDTLGLPGATVQLFVDDAFYAELEPSQMLDTNNIFFANEGTYAMVLDVPVGSLGTEFELKISHPDYPDASAKQSFPSRVVPTDLEFKANAGTDQYGYATQGIDLKIPDPAGESNYYEIGTFYKDSVAGYYGPDLFYYFQGTENSSLDPNTTTGPNYSNLFVNDRGFDGQNYELLVQLYSYSDTSNDLVVMFNSITEDRYKFATSLRAYYDSGDFGPFSEPVPLYTNVVNGLGTFGLGTIHIEELEL